MQNDDDTTNSDAYRHIVDYGNSVLSHLEAVRGRPVQPPRREELIGRHDAQFVVDSLRSHEGQRISYKFRRTPASVKSLDDLKKAYISELKWSEVHRGHVLVVRTVALPRDMRPSGDDAILTIVEDELGSVHRLRVYNYPAGKARNLGDLLPSGVVLAIKEPYCEAATEDLSGIRVDHPSDLVYLSEGSALFPTGWKYALDNPAVSPSEGLKEEGNLLFKAQKFRQAILKCVLCNF